MSITFPAISLRRTLLIARRDFLGYVKTWGFWLTALGPFFGILFGMLAPLIMLSSEPTSYAAILDETGQHGAAIEQVLYDQNEDLMREAIKAAAKYTVPREDKAEFEKILETEGFEAAKDYIRRTSPRIASMIDLPESKLVFVPPPAGSMDALRPYLLGEKQISLENGERASLSGVLHIFTKDGELKAEYWSKAPNKNALPGLANRYFRTQASTAYLESGGLTINDYSDARKNAVKVAAFNPAKSESEDGGQKVSSKDRIPYLVAAGLSAMLWFTVFTGAYMLLMSMVEEKINKVLEMLLASTRFSEIFIGKLLGVGALTLASLLPWILLAGLGFYGAMQFADGAIADGLAKAISIEMLIFLPVFLILGYLFYGSIFIALGAMAESMQDASTLMTPMVLLLTACILVVPVGIAYPESPLLYAAQFFPFSAPFAAIIRLPADPPLWETLLSVFILVISSIAVIWLSSKLFRHGVLSGGGAGAIKAWFKRAVLRRKSA